MSSVIERLADKATDVCARVAWRQWRILAEPGGIRSTEPSIIDPEALLLASIVGLPKERRLEDRLRWWTTVGLRFTGVQRFRTLLKAASERTQEEAARYAASVVSSDRSWKTLAADSKPNPSASGRRAKGPPTLTLDSPETLVLRLRAAFGVSAKSDLLAYLIGTFDASGRGRGPTVEDAARSLAYSKPSIRRALQDMVLSGLVVESRSRPAGYSIDVQAWFELLEFDVEPSPDVVPPTARPLRPAWRDWSTFLLYFDAVAALAADSSLVASAPIVQASRLRDVYERFAVSLEQAGGVSFDERRHLGEAFVPAFGRHFDALIDRMDARYPESRVGL